MPTAPKSNGRASLSRRFGKDGKHLYGWLVEFRVNSRNRFGQYTGKQSHGVLIRDDRVINGIGFGYGE